MKKNIYFVPVYLGMLKYYEKLIPYLSDKYNIGFLFLGNKAEFNDIMISYCVNKKYKYYILNYKFKGLKNIPIYKPLLNNYLYIKKCREVLFDINVDKIIFPENTSLKRRLLVREANKIGVETIVLQWALNFVESNDIVSKNRLAKSFKKNNFLKRIYINLVVFLNFLFNFDRPKSPYLFKQQNVKKIGVIDKKSIKVFAFHKYDINKIDIVGHIDNYLINVLKNRLSNKIFFEYLLAKNELSKNKKRVLVISTSFNHKDIRILSNEAQDDYYYKLFITIKKILGKDYEILFKLHPSEPDIYNNCRQLGVKIYGENTQTEELVCLSDLYIAHPQSTVNYMAQAIDKPSIFINIIGLDIYETAKNYFNIISTIKTIDDFSNVLTNFRENKFIKQYNNYEINVNSIDNILKLIN